MITPLLTVVSLCCSAQDADVPRQQQYDVSDLCGRSSVPFGVELHPVAGAVFEDATSSADDVLTFLGRQIEYAARQQDPDARCSVRPLTEVQVTANGAAHRAVQRALSGLRMRMETRVVLVDGGWCTVATDPTDGLQAEFTTSTTSLSEGATLVRLGAADRETSLAWMRERANGDGWRTLPRLRLSPLQPWSVTDVESEQVVEEYQRTPVVGGRTVVVPRLGSVGDGLLLRGRAAPLDGGAATASVAVALEGTWRGLVRPVETLETDHGPVHLPEQRQTRLGTTLTVTEEDLLVWVARSPVDDDDTPWRVLALTFRSAPVAHPRPAAQVTDASASPPTNRVAAIDGSVEQATADKVLLDVGTHDGVQVGMAFEVYRASTYVGRVSVVGVEEGACAARIVLQAHGEQVRAGDRASTRL